MKHSIGLNPVATTLTTILTVPAGYKANVSTLFISNATGNNKHFTIYWQRIMLDILAQLWYNSNKGNKQ